MTDTEEFYALHQKELLSKVVGPNELLCIQAPNGRMVSCVLADHDFDRGIRAARSGRSVPSTDMFYRTLTPSDTRGFEDLPHRSVYPRVTTQTLRLLSFVAGMRFERTMVNNFIHLD